MSFKSLASIFLVFIVVSTIRTITEAHPLTSDSDCIINVLKDLGEPQPLLLDSETDEFVFPEMSNGEIEFSQGESIKLYCTSGFRAPFNGKQSISASCVSGRQFQVKKDVFDFSKFVCHELPKHSTRRTNETCTDGAIVEIGFQTDHKWLHLMRVCHNESIAATNWVQYKQNPANRGYQHSLKRARFEQSDFYKGLDVDDLYSREIQRKTCSTILQSKPLCICLIPDKGDFFLSRGHLAARSDFIYYSHQRATFYFLNAAPQWQTFNGGNWAILEEHLKRYVDKKNLNAEIYTGTYGTLQYDDLHGISREMFLSSSKKKTKLHPKIPVPKIYYKIIVTDDDSGIVFIGVNNPHASKEEINRNYIYCENVIETVDYIPWKDSLKMGYMYACSIDEFKKFVSNSPNLPKVSRILL